MYSLLETRRPSSSIKYILWSPHQTENRLDFIIYQRKHSQSGDALIQLQASGAVVPDSSQSHSSFISICSKFITDKINPDKNVL